MKIIETDLPGCLILEPQVFGDARGFFYESFNRDKLSGIGLEVDFAQGNVSSSTRGVLRGLHYQWPRPQGKLVSVLEGEVWDVAVDIRRGSPDYGRWTAAVLSAENKRHFWIPEGFAHGFQVQSEECDVLYLHSTAHAPHAEAGLNARDPRLAITWPKPITLMSARDNAHPMIDESFEGLQP